MITYDEARDEIFSLFLTKWKTETPGVIGYVPEIRWQGVEYRSEPDRSKFWIRVSKLTAKEEQATLCTCEGLPGQRMYETIGILFIQLFCPKSELKAFEYGQKLAMIARNSFRGKKTVGGIWFKKVTINEMAPEELFEVFNITSEFEYNEIA